MSKGDRLLCAGEYNIIIYNILCVLLIWHLRYFGIPSVEKKSSTYLSTIAFWKSRTFILRWKKQTQYWNTDVVFEISYHRRNQSLTYGCGETAGNMTSLFRDWQMDHTVNPRTTGLGIVRFVPISMNFVYSTLVRFWVCFVCFFTYTHDLSPPIRSRWVMQASRARAPGRPIRPRR